ncbi:hypothetical protein Sjap_004421 [Stephania japonica]|uniref:Uncharacterized protein n=1 Tax=Stephania japonica TaxID=461633 RepID=A0AAP0PH04_9MAGN
MGDEEFGINGRAHPSMAVMSRLDRLDSMMRCLERRQGSPRWTRGGSSSNLNNLQNMKSLEAAVKEIQSKGSILDRVASLENRLFQLCLELEGSSSYSSSVFQACENAQTNQASSSNHSSSSIISLDDNLNLAYDVDPCSFHRALAERFNFLRNTMENDASAQLKNLLSRNKDADQEDSKSEKKMKTRHTKRWKRLLGC